MRRTASSKLIASAAVSTPAWCGWCNAVSNWAARWVNWFIFAGDAAAVVSGSSSASRKSASAGRASRPRCGVSPEGREPRREGWPRGFRMTAGFGVPVPAWQKLLDSETATSSSVCRADVPITSGIGPTADFRRRSSMTKLIGKCGALTRRGSDLAALLPCGVRQDAGNRQSPSESG